MKFACRKFAAFDEQLKYMNEIFENKIECLKSSEITTGDLGRTVETSLPFSRMFYFETEKQSQVFKECV